MKPYYAELRFFENDDVDGDDDIYDRHEGLKAHTVRNAAFRQYDRWCENEGSCPAKINVFETFVDRQGYDSARCICSIVINA